MNRYLLLGQTDLDTNWLQVTPNGSIHQHQIVPVKIYKPLPYGFTGFRGELTVNITFAPVSLTVPAGQVVPMVSQVKLPPDLLNITLHE